MLRAKARINKDLTEAPAKAKVSALDYGMRLLSGQMQSTGQVRQKLARKGYASEEIEQAIAQLTRLRYLNDPQFAETFFENLKKYKNFGYFGLRKKLSDRKIDEAIIKKLLAGFSIEQEISIARRLTGKAATADQHLGQARKAQDQRLIKLARMLQSRGFRAEVIQKICLE